MEAGLFFSSVFGLEDRWLEVAELQVVFIDDRIKMSILTHYTSQVSKEIDHSF
jgi:hypothetical protein